MESVSVASGQRNYMDMWHQRLGHLHGQRLKEIVQKDMAGGVKIPKTATLSFCEGKMHRKPFKPVRESRSTRNWCTVMCVARCTQTQLEDESIL